LLKIVKFTPCDKNTLQGFLTVEMTKLGLEIRDLTLHQKNGHYWIAYPSRQWTDDEGKTKYTPYINFTDEKMKERFQAGIIAELKKIGKIK